MLNDYNKEYLVFSLKTTVKFNELFFHPQSIKQLIYILNFFLNLLNEIFDLLIKHEIFFPQNFYTLE